MASPHLINSGVYHLQLCRLHASTASVDKCSPAGKKSDSIRALTSMIHVYHTKEALRCIGVVDSIRNRPARKYLILVQTGTGTYTYIYALCAYCITATCTMSNSN